jgi:membrane protease subunit (stomatin/prohibitin family)
LILALLATLGAIVVAFVLYPVFTEATAGAPAAFDEAELALADLRDKKAMLYEVIQELDFEKASGKVSDSDYESTRNNYLAQVTAVMEKLDALAPPESPSDPPSKKPASTRTKKSAKKQTGQKSQSDRECVSCGELNPKGSNFCLECGKPFALTCASCGESVPAKARFCNACGENLTA